MSEGSLNILSDHEVLIKKFRKRKTHKKHSLLWRLRKREIGIKTPILNFYQNLPLNQTISNVNVYRKLF